MFHHMRFIKWNHATWLESDDIHMHVVTHIRLLGKSGGCPYAISTRHLNRCNIMIAGYKGFRHFNTFTVLISFTNPMEFNVLVAIVFYRPFAAGW